MKIVIDLQGAQGSNRSRGIGRYSLAFAKAFAKLATDHEVIIFLNGLFPNTIDELRADFSPLLPPENIVVWTSPGPVHYIDEVNTWRRQAAEISREAFLASLRPDFVVLTSLFEGLVDDAVTSIGRLPSGIETAVVLYDLIPYVRPIPYLENPVVRKNYLNKIDYLRRADLLLAISDSTRGEAIDYLGYPPENVVSISTGNDEFFTRRDYPSELLSDLAAKHALTKPFVMYTGGIDSRKNVEGLVRAFAGLPKALRDQYQLGIVCNVQEGARLGLIALAEDCGLLNGQLVLTGFVPDEDLVALYHTCDLFVFPSLHEGFGLPALEALSCGALVIASDKTSLPEVVGMPEALFDATSEVAITDAMLRGLTDIDFRRRLRDNAAERSKLFSWESTAQKCKAALEVRFARKGGTTGQLKQSHRPKLAFISPVPGAHTGIADYSSELLPELSRFYDIEVVVQQQETISDTWILANVPVISREDFERGADRYERILYHFGNSSYHQHMFGLLAEFPGAVVLHDFFLSSIQAHRDVHDGETHAWARELYMSHGYKAMAERYHEADSATVVYRYPANFSVLSDALGVIVHSEYPKKLAVDWYGYPLSRDWQLIPLLRVPALDFSKASSRRHLGYSDTDFLVCSFGLLGALKLNHKLLEAFLESHLKNRPEAFLIFVGEASGAYGESIRQKIAESGYSEQIRIVGWTDQSEFRHYLAAADCAVQLRTLSRGETSAAILDCLNYGIPTIVNAHGSAALLSDDIVEKISDDVSAVELAAALDRISTDEQLRHKLSRNGFEEIRSRHAPRACAEQYANAIEKIYGEGNVRLLGVEPAISCLPSGLPTVDDLKGLSISLERTMSSHENVKRLFIDISELVQRDSRTGVQRVTRSLLKLILESPPSGYRVEPVYATEGSDGYWFARKFTSAFMGCDAAALDDEPLSYNAGDIFLGLDLQPHIVPLQEPFLKTMRMLGVKIYFVVYDLLPVEFPECFFPGAIEGHSRWLRSVANYDGLVCISKSVADKVFEWITTDFQPRVLPLGIGHFHCGADIENSSPTLGGVAENLTALKYMEEHDTFLMVGTIEPRKAHTQVLSGFERLWRAGGDVCLVIVGKQGWMVESFIDSLRAHPELGRKLFWFDQASDELLERIYRVSACLIAASLDEGFGLPLIEAAINGVPILARDIPVFREVAGSHASYFCGENAEDIESAIVAWRKGRLTGKLPELEGMRVSKWRESVSELLDVILNGHWEMTWTPDSRRVFKVAGDSFGASTGVRNGEYVKTNGEPGYLFHGPYINLSKGRYSIRVIGRAGFRGAQGARIDVTTEKGVNVLYDAPLNSAEGQSVLTHFEVESDCALTDLEVRLWVEAGSDLVVRAIELKSLAA